MSEATIEELRSALRAIVDVANSGDDSEDAFFGEDFDVPFEVARDLLAREE